MCFHKIAALYKVKVEYIAHWKWFTIDTLNYPGKLEIGNVSNGCFVFNWKLFKTTEKSRLEFAKLLLIWRGVQKLDCSQIVCYFLYDL